MLSVNRLIQTARAEVGYLEKRSNRDLYDKTANVGKNNYTKYALELDNFGNVYNGRKQGFSWCDVFVDWCFIHTFGLRVGIEMLCQTEKSLGAGCKYSMDYYRKAGRFYTTPNVGDQVFFTRDGRTCAHTGIVAQVSFDCIYTIEGNAASGPGVTPNGGSVVCKMYKRNNTAIIGYGRPRWELVEESENLKMETVPWWTEALEWAKNKGLTIDGDRPTEPMTRAEAWITAQRLYNIIREELKNER